MTRRKWIQNKDGKLVEVPKDKKLTPRRGPYINVGDMWSRTTKIEFSEKSMDDYIKENKK